jgi:hypothetical protein
MEIEKFESWAIVELFGHNQIAGKCSEQQIAGTNMLRIDVPETDRNPSFTRLLGHGAIYAINPVTEEVAKHWAQSLQVSPITVWDVRDFIKKAEIALSEKNNHNFEEELEGN